ncbi:MAG TPA: hypothetical protein VM695_02275 [Phycisphaerae bacterium]|nr:hypothetical protein [Phycisphaerae bacterium]
MTGEHRTTPGEALELARRAAAPQQGPKGPSLSAVRRNCPDCSGGSRKYVSYCPCDGVHSTRCEFWLFRFGMTPGKAKRRYGKHAITPELMPPANTDLDDLPENIRDYQADGQQAVGGQEAPQPHVDV